MISKDELEKALSIQDRSYKLIKWLGNAIHFGFIPVTKVHAVANTGDAAREWIHAHRLNLPADCRPQEDEIAPFSNFFGTYLETSFDLVANPAEVYINDCGCHCPFCGRLANPRHLKPKSISDADKKRAVKLRVRRMEALAQEDAMPSFEMRIRECLKDESVRINASLASYGMALLDRLKGISHGPAVLALWRDFAWTPAGSPIHNFKLTSRRILEAEKSLIIILRQHASH